MSKLDEAILQSIGKEKLEEAYNKGRASMLTDLLEKDWWTKQQRMVIEEWLKNINSN